jgi:hypothetical protein
VTVILTSKEQEALRRSTERIAKELKEKRENGEEIKIPDINLKNNFNTSKYSENPEELAKNIIKRLKDNKENIRNI